MLMYFMQPYLPYPCSSTEAGVLRKLDWDAR